MVLMSLIHYGAIYSMAIFRTTKIKTLMALTLNIST